MFFRRGLPTFARGLRALVTRAANPEAENWFKKQLADTGLDKKVTKEQLDKSKPSVRVFFNQNYLEDSSKVVDALVKVPAINVSGDRDVMFQNGTHVNGRQKFFEQIPVGHPEFLAPSERLNAGKKVVQSNSVVFARGGYPEFNPILGYKPPFNAAIFSMAGASFENSYLHSKLFMLDKHNPVIKKGSPFDHLYDGVPLDFESAHKEIGKFDGSDTMSRIRLGLTFLGRTESGIYHPTFGKSNSVVFLTQPYYRHQLEDVSMLLSSVNANAEQAGKPALLKATSVGMGYFAKIDCSYDIQHLLFPYYLRAYRKLLEEQAYPWIAEIEFPIFNELQEIQFDGIFQDYKGPIKVSRTRRDVLAFTEEEVAEFTPSLVNPSDAFSLTGNEWGYGSVEAMIGLNSSLRMDQVHHTNPLILSPEHHVAVNIRPDFSAELTSVQESAHEYSLKA